MITRLKFRCNFCSDPKGQACEAIIPIDLQYGAPAIQCRPMCLVSSCFDTKCNWVFDGEELVSPTTE